MAMVNVNRKVTDQFYRYKMPKVLAKVEGKGNGIKTVIVNMVDIGKALRRPASYPTKYFGCELGAQTQIDKKNDRFIVNGSHDADKLQEILDGFIERFVLCPECENPETDITVIPKKEKISQRCLACGHQGQIDLTHRLTTFILKNPPASDEAATTPHKGKKVRGGKRENRQNGDSAHPHSPTSEDAESGSVVDVNLRDSSVPVGTRLQSESSLDDWSTDTSEEAVKNRMNSLTDSVRGMVVNEDSEKTQEQRMNIFFKFMKEKVTAGKIEGFEKDIVGEAERLDVKDKSVLVLAELLFNEDLLNQIKQYRPLFVRFLANNHKAQRALLGAFELIVGKSFPEKLLPKVPHILKGFYDHDYVEEEILISWSEKVSKKYVSKEVATAIHKKAAPFIDWLKTAEEESSDEEENDLQVVYAKNPTAVEQKETKEDDLDIDAI